jgi:hypothetical protein
LFPRVVHQNSPHQLRSHGEEVNLILPMDRCAADQTQVRFMDQGCALQGVVGGLAGQTVPRQAAKFVVNKRDKRFASGRIAVTPPEQQSRDLAG